MNNLSLKKLSITVVLASLASNLVFASNDVTKALPKMAEPASPFSQLITDYDADKSNTLSAKELAKNAKLAKSFDKLDANGDKELTEKEFNQHLAKMKKHLL
jgi:hypothetical protein